MEPILRALATPRRREILRLLWGRERSAGEIHRALGDVTFGAVSQHLRVLAESGLVRGRRDGRSRLYRARPEELGPFGEWLASVSDRPPYPPQPRARLEEARPGPPAPRGRTS